MRYRELGKTGLRVSEIGLGAEWLERHSAEEVKAVIDRCEEHGINILDCWMPEPNVRTNIGAAIAGKRERWIIQGHLGSTWQNGQYVRTREMGPVKAAFADLLARLRTDYIDLGMIHFVDEVQEYRRIMEGEFLQYALERKRAGTIRHIGMSTHNPAVGILAAQSGVIEMILFSVNPASTSCRPTRCWTITSRRKSMRAPCTASTRCARNCTASANRTAWASP